MNAWLFGDVFNNASPMNNSSSQGWLYYSDSRVTFKGLTHVNAVTNCDGNEGVLGADATAVNSAGQNASAALLITQHMVSNCQHHP
jgi:hypothetical protein